MMTHDELLAKVNNLPATIGLAEFKVRHDALIAVVELHKPFQFENGPDLYKLVCQHCQLGVVGDVYPCKTIQAIEKELI